MWEEKVIMEGDRVSILLTPWLRLCLRKANNRRRDDLSGKESI